MLQHQLNDNDFTILGLPQQFNIEEKQLTQNWKNLLAQVHPDRHIAQGQAAQRLATQWTVRINEAYQRLLNPMTRAAFLCELAGESIQAETNTAMPAEFLMQQIEWREALEEAQTEDQVYEVQNIVHKEKTIILSSLAWLIDEKGNYPQAAQQVRALMFIERFLESIYNKLDALDI